MKQSNPCAWCGVSFSRHPRDSDDQWAAREFCSIGCANKLRKDVPPHLRFWIYADKRANNECWPWNGTTDQHGYGRVPFRRSSIKAHRLSFEMHKGPIPDDLIICHRCDNPNCVNPNHLFAGTYKDNAQDMARKGRINPKSYLNLRPGAAGVHGAGPHSNMEIQNVRKR